jgi:hypothetical protein
MDKATKSIRMDRELWHRAGVKALSMNMTLQDFIVRFLTDYLARVRRKGGGIDKVLCLSQRNRKSVFTEPLFL